jgi:hypothetical protein
MTTFPLLLILFLYITHRETRIRELKRTIAGAFSRKDGLCGVATVAPVCFARLLNGEACPIAGNRTKPAKRLLVDELLAEKPTHGRTKLSADLRGEEVPEPVLRRRRVNGGLRYISDEPHP